MFTKIVQLFIATTAFSLVTCVEAITVKGEANEKKKAVAAAAVKVNQEDQIREVFNIVKKINQTAAEQPLAKEERQLAQQDFSQEELFEVCSTIAKKIRTNDELFETPYVEQVDGIMKKLTAQLKDFRVNGVAVEGHFRWSFFYGPRHFTLPFAFKNRSGELKVQTLQFDYTTIGAQGDLAYVIDIAFVIGDLSRFDTRTPLRLGTGVSVGLPIGPGASLIKVGVTVIPVINVPDVYFVIGHVGFGLNGITLAMVLPNGECSVRA